MPTRFWEVPNVIAIGSAGIALLAMFVSLVQTVFARKAATEARRQADAALGEVPPLIFLDEATDRDTTSGRDANLTIINLNRRDLRILQIDIGVDPAIVVAIETGEMRDFITAVYRRMRDESGPLTLNLRGKHFVVTGSPIGATNRIRIPLTLGRLSSREYNRDTVELTATVRYVLLDARHREGTITASASVPFRG